MVNAQNPTAFGPVIKRAKEAGVVLVAFDNILDTEDAINVNVDQKGLGEPGRTGWCSTCRRAARSSRCAASPGRRSTPTGTTASTRSCRQRQGLGGGGGAGKWDDPTAQKATADAIAVHKSFDGITAQGGDTGVVQAMIDAGHPFVPFGGETENGFASSAPSMRTRA